MAVQRSNPAKQILQSDLGRVLSACPVDLPAPAKPLTTYQEIIEYEASAIHPVYFVCASEARGIIGQIKKLQEVE